MNGSGRWHAEQAWLGHRAENVLIEVENGRISAIEERIPAPPDAIALKGWTVPGFANVHSHAFQRLLRGEIESGGGDFWEWRAQMYRFTEWDPADYFKHARLLFREMLEAGITAVGEFHYLHGHGNELGEALIDAAREEGIRITLIDACYLRGGMDGGPLEAEQLAFSDGDADSWARRMDELKETNGARIAAAIHSVRAVDPESMRVVATYARERRMPLHIHLAEQAAEVEACLAVEGVTPTELLQREGILGPDLTAVHAIHLNERDISLLGENEVSICACSTTERDLGDRVGPLRALEAAGCDLAVGSDSNAVVDMLEEARGLELDQRRATGRRVLHQPEDLLRASTVNGMRTLGWESGELRTGMLADFVTLDAPRDLWREMSPSYLIYGFSGRDVTNVVVGGETVVSR
ncbi:MAG: formimidoylglutamate deiminase [Chloroflexi bacterium]|nr:MAG: formimidoylglutamate deiminase [Chloroflexota bacterium]TMG20848.1 MAG: formimidoylglutamate deiminase [Chloroflexota bacterium]TMG64176.1 MAG: formimidoylglutamate deiminase [Chloroflexota bacterium]